MKMDGSEKPLEQLKDQGQGHQNDYCQQYNNIGNNNSLEQERQAKIPPNFNQDFPRSQVTKKGRKNTTTGNGYHKQNPSNTGKLYAQGDCESGDIIYRGLLNLNPSSMHHDQPEMFRLVEKSLSDLSVISEDQYNSLVKNPYAQENKEEEKQPILNRQSEVVKSSSKGMGIKSLNSEGVFQYQTNQQSQTQKKNSQNSKIDAVGATSDINIPRVTDTNRGQSDISKNEIVALVGAMDTVALNTKDQIFGQNTALLTQNNSHTKQLQSNSKLKNESLYQMQTHIQPMESLLVTQIKSIQNLAHNATEIVVRKASQQSIHQPMHTAAATQVLKSMVPPILVNDQETKIKQNSMIPLPPPSPTINEINCSQIKQTFNQQVTLQSKRPINDNQSNIGQSPDPDDKTFKFHQNNISISSQLGLAHVILGHQDSRSQFLNEKNMRHLANSVPIQNSNKSNKIDDAGSLNSKNAPVKSILKSKTLFGESNEELTGSKRIVGQKSKVSMLQDNKMPGIIPSKTQIEVVVDHENIEVKMKTPQEIEDEENERRAKFAFKTLAAILKKAKEEKHRLLNEQADNIIDENNYGTSYRIDPLEMKPWTIYPEGRFSILWDVFTTLLVIISCMIAPFMLAFQETSNNSSLFYLDTIINILFAFDMIMQFFTAYIDEDTLELVQDKKGIAMGYIKSWFFIDLISIIPFDLILSYANVNRITRFTRIGKLAKIVRMFKMVRLLKFAKVRSKLMKNFQQVVQIAAGFDRLLFMMLIFLILIHVIACFWVFIGKFDEGSKNNWIYSKGIVDMDDYNLYVTSFYFSVTTIVTVGYGDITAISAQEKILAVFLMIFGVIAFSFATGALSSIIANIDQSEALLKEKMTTLAEIQFQYKINNNLYNNLVKAIRYDQSKKSKDLSDFMNELPYKLRIELAVVINKQMISEITFFKDKTDQTFLAWIGEVLTPLSIQEEQYIFKETEAIVEMYFMVNGFASFVLPMFNQKSYFNIERGMQFGHADLFGRRNLNDQLICSQKKKNDLLRLFTCQATTSCELLTIQVVDLEKMRTEFSEIYEKLHKPSQQDAINLLSLKKKKIKECINEKTLQEMGGAGLLFRKKTTDSDIGKEYLINHLGRIPSEFFQGMDENQIAQRKATQAAILEASMYQDKKKRRRHKRKMNERKPFKSESRERSASPQMNKEIDSGLDDGHKKEHKITAKKKKIVKNKFIRVDSSQMTDEEFRSMDPFQTPQELVKTKAALSSALNNMVGQKLILPINIEGNIKQRDSALYQIEIEGPSKDNNIKSKEDYEIPLEDIEKIPSFRIRENIEHLKILGKEKKQNQARSLLAIATQKNGSNESSNSSDSDESGSQSGVEDSIARIEEQVGDLKDMFNVMMSSAKVMTNRIERRLKRVAVKTGVAQRRKLKY